MMHSMTRIQITLWAIAAVSLCGPGVAQVQDVAASLSPDGKTARVRWTTPQPTRCSIEYGPTAAYGSVAKEDPSSLRGTTNNRDSGVGYASNHRVGVPAIQGRAMHYRIVAENREGKVSRSADRVLAPAPLRPTQPGVSRIPLSIDRGKRKVAEPHVVVGVPFPPGRLSDPGRVRLLSHGQEIPSQVAVVSRHWRDHSIRWAQVAFQAPRAGDRLELEYGDGVQRQPAEPIRVRIEGRSFSIAAGERRIMCTCDGLGKGNVAIDVRGPSQIRPHVSFPRPVLVDASGKRYVARPERVRLAFRLR